MEVLVGPTYSMDVSPACGVRDRKDKVVSSSSSCLFLKGDGGGEGEDRHESGDKFESGYGSDDSSDRSSSIGDPGDTEEEDEEKENDDVSLSKGEELQKSKLCLDSLEDSLPIKRGLSNHYSGRSKSFANLSDVSTVKELGKAENPFNKRRRVLIASKWSRRSSFYSWQNPKSMPLLAALNEEDDDRDHHQQQQQRRRLQNLSSCNDHKQEDGEEEDEELRSKTQATRFNGSRLKMGFKSQSCFSLADLQEEEEQ